MRLRNGRRGRAPDAGDLHPAWGSPKPIAISCFEWIEHSFDFKDDREAFETTDDVAHAAAAMFEYGAQLIAEKRAHPADDMLSVVCNATLPGEDPPQLTDQELQFFFSLLWAAGADTTRNAIAGAIVALTEFPDQLDVLRDDPSVDADRDRGDRALDASGRVQPPHRDPHASSSAVTRSRAGDKVVFWEASANRDELVFAEPFRFDVRRQPNPHLGFGHGVHHCLGASLARLEIRVVMTELLARVGTIELTGARRVDAQQQAHRDPAAARAPDRALIAAGRRRSEEPGTGGCARVGLRELHHPRVDVVDPLTVERARRPRSPEVPPRLHLAAEAEVRASSASRAVVSAWSR